MGDRKTIGSDELGRELREWSGAETSVSEVELRRILRSKLAGDQRTPRLRTALVAAAASAIAVLIGIQATRHPAPPDMVGATEVVYETGDNVILVLRDDGPPIYVVKDVLETGDSP